MNYDEEFLMGLENVFNVNKDKINEIYINYVFDEIFE